MAISATVLAASSVKRRPAAVSCVVLALPGGPNWPRLASSSWPLWARQLTPAADMAAALLRPCPGIGLNVTSGSPAPMASSDVKPPAFSTRTSHAAIMPAMSSVQPSRWARYPLALASASRYRGGQSCGHR